MCLKCNDMVILLNLRYYIDLLLNSSSLVRISLLNPKKWRENEKKTYRVHRTALKIQFKTNSNYYYNAIVFFFGVIKSICHTECNDIRPMLCSSSSQMQVTHRNASSACLYFGVCKVVNFVLKSMTRAYYSKYVDFTFCCLNLLLFFESIQIICNELSH